MKSLGVRANSKAEDGLRLLTPKSKIIITKTRNNSCKRTVSGDGVVRQWGCICYAPTEGR